MPLCHTLGGLGAAWLGRNPCRVYLFHPGQNLISTPRWDVWLHWPSGQIYRGWVSLTLWHEEAMFSDRVCFWGILLPLQSTSFSHFWIHVNLTSWAESLAVPVSSSLFPALELRSQRRRKDHTKTDASGTSKPAALASSWAAANELQEFSITGFGRLAFVKLIILTFHFWIILVSFRRINEKYLFKVSFTQWSNLWNWEDFWSLCSVRRKRSQQSIDKAVALFSFFLGRQRKCHCIFWGLAARPRSALGALCLVQPSLTARQCVRRVAFGLRVCQHSLSVKTHSLVTSLFSACDITAAVQQRRKATTRGFDQELAKC